MTWRKVFQKSSWSARETLFSAKVSPSDVSTEKLHHLLRLSALPMPLHHEEEMGMKKDLAQQLSFVQRVQKIDTSRVEPLTSLVKEMEITMDLAIAAKDQPDEAHVNWQPLELTKQSFGPYYFVKKPKL